MSETKGRPGGGKSGRGGRPGGARSGRGPQGRNARGPGGRGGGGARGGAGGRGRGGGFGGGRDRRVMDKKELQTNEQMKETQASAPALTEGAEGHRGSLQEWMPKTEAGRLVKSGEITTMEELWARHLPILEAEIIDTLVPDLQEKVIDTRKTAYVRSSGRKFNFSAFVLVGDGKKYIGLGMGSDKERFPATRKAGRDARLKLMPVRVGAGSWQDFSDTTRSVPFKVIGKAGSVRVTLQPAPKGTGLVVGKQIQDVFRFAGITDVWGFTKGSSDTKLNYVRAAYNALEQLNNVRMSPDMVRKFSKQGGHHA